MTTFRKITEAELAGFQGCQFKQDGEWPDICERQVGQEEFTCIVDDATCEIHIYRNGTSSENSEFTSWQLQNGEQMTRRARTAIAWTVMQSSLTESELAAFGFEQVS